MRANLKSRQDISLGNHPWVGEKTKKRAVREERKAAEKAGRPARGGASNYKFVPGNVLRSTGGKGVRRKKKKNNR